MDHQGPARIYWNVSRSRSAKQPLYASPQAMANGRCGRGHDCSRPVCFVWSLASCDHLGC